MCPYAQSCTHVLTHAVLGQWLWKELLGTHDITALPQNSELRKSASRSKGIWYVAAPISACNDTSRWHDRISTEQVTYHGFYV